MKARLAKGLTQAQLAQVCVPILAQWPPLSPAAREAHSASTLRCARDACFAAVLKRPHSGHTTADNGSGICSK